MEITFDTGFNDLGNSILEKNKNKGESSWDKFQRIKKEKKKEFKTKKTKDEDYFIMDTSQNELKAAAASAANSNKISKEEKLLQKKNLE
jgi:hypothetical protein